ncbi:MAG: hypothetical protein JWL90_4568 [Chthoniobacteraceae bacterium]|nr:hypothetical protein [Chthoniobacteraceae bacterium]
MPGVAARASHSRTQAKPGNDQLHHIHPGEGCNNGAVEPCNDALRPDNDGVGLHNDAVQLNNRGGALHNGRSSLNKDALQLDNRGVTRSNGCFRVINGGVDRSNARLEFNNGFYSRFQRLDSRNSIFSAGLRTRCAAASGVSSINFKPRSGPSTLTAVARLSAVIQLEAKIVTSE